MRSIVMASMVMVGFGFNGTVRADEEKVPLDKVPKAILDSVKARFADGKLTGAGKEVEDGKPVYEVSLKLNGKNIDVTLTPEGKLLGIEKEIAAKELPKAVAKTLKEKYPKAEYKMVEEVIKVKKGVEKLEYYEVLLVTAAKKNVEVTVSPNGKINNEEDKNKEKK